jgi:integrase
MMGPMKPLKRKTQNGTRYQARVWDPAKPGFRSLGTFTREREAKQAMADFYAKPRPKRLETCDSFAGRWADDYPRPRPSTNKHNRERVKKFGEDFKGISLADIDRPTARAWALENKNRLSAVRAMFTDAVDDELVYRNPFANLRLPQSRGRKDLVALTEDQIDALADKALDIFDPHAAEMMRAAVLFSGYVGVRQGELFALRFNDLGHDELTVRQSRLRDGTLGPTKNGKERTIVFLPQARDAVARVPRRPGQQWLLVNPRDGEPLNYNSHSYYWRALRSAAGHPRMAWHELRHACATLLIERGLTPATVAHQLGHTDGGILIAKTYGHPDQQRMRDEIKAAFRAPGQLKDVSKLRAEAS